MEKLRYILFLLCLPMLGLGQNLIKNPGFEQYDHLPSFMSKLGKDFEKSVKYWVVPNQASTDLISPRLESKNLKGIPPRSGKNMAGIVINGDFWSEYLGIKLKEPLVPGRQYYLEFWMSMPRFYSKRKPVPTYLNPHFGALFSDKIYHFDKRILHGQPQVACSEQIFIEPGKWTKISGTFIADTTDTYMYIGQFWDKEQKPELAIGYYFIDDVYLEAFRSTAVDYEPSRYYQIEGQVASVIMDNIYFETDRHTLLPESYVELNKLVNIMNKNPGINIQIQGHTDSQGSELHNLSLSERRSQAVFDYLVSEGIPAERLQAQGFGFSKPVADNRSDEGRQQNRRVEFVVSGATAKGGEILGPEQVYRFSSQLHPEDYWGRSCIGQERWCEEKIVAPEASLREREEFRKYSPTTAHDFVLRRSENERVLFINVDSQSPQHWVFIQNLLKTLREQGFTHLALPGSSRDKELSNRGYPVLSSTPEAYHPVYGSLIRKALQLEFEIASYSPNPDQLRKADNIIRKQKLPAALLQDEEIRKQLAQDWASALNLTNLLRKRSDARVLVLCSETQAQEHSEDDRVYMASWFKRFSQIDPLSIDQVRMTPRCGQPTAPIYAYTRLTAPSVYTKKEAVFVERPSHTGYANRRADFDVQIYHPNASSLHERPSWLQSNGRKAFFFNPDKHQMSSPCLIQAYHQGEEVDTAVPADVIEIPDGRTQRALMLVPGPYTFVLRDLQQYKKLEVQVK
ncbi:MAG: OmpA family protein [Bacteroidota bacterium]